jgi:hypothetical protein
LTANTLARFDQNNKLFLSIDDQQLSELGQELSVSIQQNQMVTRLLFLILKSTIVSARRRAAVRARERRRRDVVEPAEHALMARRQAFCG